MTIDKREMNKSLFFHKITRVTTNNIITTFSLLLLLSMYYKSPRREIVSHTFKHLINNLKLYNRVKI